MSHTRLHDAPRDHTFTPCPYCGNLPNERAELTDDEHPLRPEGPVAGDAALCSDCWRISVYLADGTRRRATEAEYREAFDRIVAEYGANVARQLGARAVFGHEASGLRIT
jgi:hypothetical protein